VALKNGAYKVNPILVFLTGLVVVALSILVYLLVIRNVYGRFESSELTPDANVLKSLLLGSEPEIAILNSGYTSNLLPEGSSWQNENIDTWEKFITNLNIKYEVIDDAVIEGGNHFKYKLIVLPGSKSLSDIEIAQLKKFLRNGGSIFATSGTASYSNDGKWRGWQFFSEVFGINFTREIGNDERTKIHTLRGGLPITANVPTGFPLRVATWDRPVAVEVLDPRTTQVSFWYNYRLEEGLVREGIKNSAGIVYGTYGKGRFVWMGFEINSIIGVKEDYVYFDRVFRNSINWLTYSPIAYIRDWPTGFNSAAAIVMPVTDDNKNIDQFVNILKEENIKSTFFIDNHLADREKNLLKYLKSFGEIASLVDMQDQPIEVKDSVKKYRQIVNSLTDKRISISNSVNTNVSGILPYFNNFNQTSLNPIIDAGFKYILTDSLSDRSVPKIFVKDEERIISITKSARDDYEIIRDHGLENPDFQFYSYQEDIDRVLFEGGLYIFKIHPDYQCKPENISVVTKVIQELKQKGYWITTLAQIAKWYLSKEYVELRTKKLGKSRVAVTITNPGKSGIDDLKIDIDLNQNAVKINIESEIIGTKKAAYLHKDGSRFVYLIIDDLEAGESRTYYIDYDILKV
jgi:hypothetical protein